MKNKITRSLKSLRPLLLWVFFILSSVVLLHAQAIPFVTGSPSKMNYQAVARDASGNPLVSQAISVRFSIHSTTAGGTIQYQETQALTTNAFGLFSTAIGSGTVTSGSWGAIDWKNDQFYLQVEMDPAGGSSWLDMGTSQLISVPYAFHATTAGSSLSDSWVVNGSDISNRNPGFVGVGTATPAHTLDVYNANPSSFSGVLNAAAGQPFGSNSDAFGVSGYNTVDDYYGSGGYFQGGWRGVVGQVVPTGSNYYYGVIGFVSGGTGSNYAVYGNGDQIGNYGYASGPGTGLTSYYGPSFLEAAGVFGSGTVQTNTNSISYGVVGEATSNLSKNNAGVFGYAANSTGTSPRNWGVFGLTDDANTGCGVLGISDGAGTNMHALEGDIMNGTDQIAIFGYASGVTASDYAGYFSGQIYATAASSTIKAFKIDHPLDPANKYLYHSSVESDEMLDMYSGNVTTDAQGLAVVQLPTYFQALNKNFRYQFTCINQFAQVIVGEKIHDNQFTIRTDKPNVEVSWTVMGVRQDAAANRYRIQNEVDKPDFEKGTYLVPEAYGLTRASEPRQPSYEPKGTPVRTVRRPVDDPKMK